ncbi:DAK2 domain-containing protein [Clostridiales bacterium F-3ap]|uniref:DAK2 domain-containing protein n=2 Tax=Anaerotalea alkaliphila TaxID=2662126 RepID=A0A7X5HUM5_9FIRM|nr:DAK2 domain-containing protein [Anaerotalea alkaliphila]
MFISGAKFLESKKQLVDDMNVFPVPDGDTGTNMTLTILSAVRELEGLGPEAGMDPVAKAISSGSLRGARGNSGVILSQIFRGFTKEISGKREVDVVLLADALNHGAETAYKAVMRPKEGTILTVAQALADRAAEMAVKTDDMVTALEEILAYGEAVLARTPEMLPVLKQAGVVDAGAQGLLFILEGALLSLREGKVLDFGTGEAREEGPEGHRMSPQAKAAGSSEEILFGYCTEFIVNLSEPEGVQGKADDLRRYLETVGDSIVSVADEEIIKIHVHTNDPGEVMQKALSLGALTNIKVENMRVQHSNILHGPQDSLQGTPRKAQGFVVVSIGEGLSAIFTGLGADTLVEGGQTMNPSTQDLVHAIEKVHADTVFVLPNNKNIILAAEQAGELVTDREVRVVGTRSIPQGITAMLAFEPSADARENAANMAGSLEAVKTGQLTFAVRDTMVDDHAIQAGDYLGIGEDKILAVSKDLEETARTLLDKLVDDDSELVTIYYGKDVEEEAAKDIAAYLESRRPACEVDVQYGGQPLYYYLFSVE